MGLIDYFFSSGVAREKYEFSVLQAIEVSKRGFRIEKPELIRAGERRELLVLHEQCGETHVLVLLNPLNKNTEVQIPDGRYWPSSAAINLLNTLPASDVSELVIRKLIGQRASGGLSTTQPGSVCGFSEGSTP